MADVCLNGGTCRNLVGSYRCDCPDGWFGDKCELGNLFIFVFMVPFKNRGKYCNGPYIHPVILV